MEETGSSSQNQPDPHLEAMKEYLQIFSSYFRDAMNSEIERFIGCVANYFRHTIPNELQIIRQNGTVRSVENNERDEEKNQLKLELEKAQALLRVYKSALKLSNTTIEKHLGGKK